KMHLLSSEIRHAARSRFEAQHKRSFQVVLRAAQFFRGYLVFFELSKFLQNRLDHTAGRFERGSCVNGKATGISIGIHFRENRIRESLPLANILKKPRAHSAAEHRV